VSEYQRYKTKASLGQDVGEDGLLELTPELPMEFRVPVNTCLRNLVEALPELHTSEMLPLSALAQSSLVECRKQAGPGGCKSGSAQEVDAAEARVIVEQQEKLNWVSELVRCLRLSGGVRVSESVPETSELLSVADSGEMQGAAGMIDEKHRHSTEYHNLSGYQQGISTRYQLGSDFQMVSEFLIQSPDQNL